ncbi:MAG TPA: DUF6513 domain-containing protein [Pirellulales bacterium]|nr:DUF6513 domain-containing protein [Pirellulales bacterium]
MHADLSSDVPSSRREHWHFVTGRLAEHALRGVVKNLAAGAAWDYSIDVLGITVAALMTPEWIARKLRVPAEATRILVPGYCQGDLSPIAEITALPVERGPKDLRDLPEFFGRKKVTDYGTFDIQILAEINHAPQLSLDTILAEAARFKAAGADVIDLGCNPGDAWSGVGEAVRALKDAGHRVSIDSLNPAEIAPAVRAGAELVLSVNSSNRDAALDWGCEVVAIPDVPENLEGLDETVDFLAKGGVRLRIDAILEPIGFGFARSLGRYLTVRDRYPDAEMMMGIGNLTELTDADSAAINVLLIGFCQELGIRSVLTTEVIGWARSSVRECDLARRLMYHAIKHRSLPKHVEPRLVMLRDARIHERGEEELERLARDIKDPNYRLFAEGGKLHLVTSGLHLSAIDPFDLFELLMRRDADRIDASHAFYLGYELAKATTALTLGKDYRQDQALDWGYLTKPEISHRQTKMRSETSDRSPPDESEAV